MRQRQRVRALAWGLALYGTLAAAAPVAAQQQVGQGIRTSTGNVIRPDPADSTSVLPVQGTWAVLHRVAGADSGPIDSVRTNAAGGYRFTFQPRPSDSTSIYFVSAERGGVTYFAPPVPLSGSETPVDTIVVFDTTSAPMELAVRSRHMLLGRPDSAGRFVILEVFELENTSRITMVAPNEGQWTWTIDLPPGAQNVVPGQGDITRDAVEVSGTTVRVIAPIAPGLKQVSFSYTLGSEDFPLSIPRTSAVEFLEVLVEPPRATVQGSRLSEVASAEIQGRALRRFVADTMPAGSVIRVDMATIQLSQRTIYVAALLVALGMVMLLSLGRSFQQRRAGDMRPRRHVGGETPEQIAQRIVALDARFRRRSSPTEEEREVYERTRAALKDSLTEALVRRDEA